MPKYIFVTGGVVSGLGKGITAASLGRILKNRGLKIFMQKFDPYINIDPKTISPFQHGEVFVTVDGAETDLDLGHYERFIDEELNQTSSITTGRIYSAVINKERAGEYNGATVQVIPHITNEIKNKIYDAGNVSRADIVITEIGGTVGDIESLPFIEAVRQVRMELGKENVLFVHATLIPLLDATGELKTKPSQHSVHELRSYGIEPDILVCRSSQPLDRAIKEKLSLFCSVKYENVIEANDAKNLYEIPLRLCDQNIDEIVIKQLQIDCPPADMRDWRKLVETVNNLHETVIIAIIGIHTQMTDAYLSITEALKHAGFTINAKVKIRYINSERLDENNITHTFENVDGILIPGYEAVGTHGKLLAIKYARTFKVPFFGINLGFQLAIIEYAKNVANINLANTTELDDKCECPIIKLVMGKKDCKDTAGAYRIGNFPEMIIRDTHAWNAYKDDIIFERHRNYYEFNIEYKDILEKAGLVFSAFSPDKSLVEIIEIKDHPWFLATLANPQFKSRPNKAHALFKRFLKASFENRRML